MTAAVYHVRRRVYHSTIGWLQRDPLGRGAGVNLYEYVSGLPLNRTDPFGLLDPVVLGCLGGLTASLIVSGLQLATGQDKHLCQVAADALCDTLTGCLIGFLASYGAGVTASAATVLQCIGIGALVGVLNGLCKVGLNQICEAFFDCSFSPNWECFLADIFVGALGGFGACFLGIGDDVVDVVAGLLSFDATFLASAACAAF